MDILLVEDDKAIVATLGALLREEGYEVTCAATQDGALDYIAKPFRPRELLSRIRAALRAKAGAGALALGDVTVDPATGTVRKAGAELFLSALEYRLLLFFAQRKGRLVTREMLRDAIWDTAGEYVADNSLNVYIKRLREKVEDDPADPRLIVTARGLGYRVEG